MNNLHDADSLKYFRDDELEQLTNILVRDYVNFSTGHFFITHDNSNEYIAESVGRSALKYLKIGNVSLVNIDKMRPNKNEPLKELPLEFKEFLEHRLRRYQTPSLSNNAVLMLHSKRDGDGFIGKEIADIAQKYGKIGGLSGCTYDVLKAGFHEDNNPKFSQELYEFLSKEKEIIITDDAGTNAVVTLNHDKYKLVLSNGILKPGTYANPIPAEVFTFPENVEGKYVVRSSYGAYDKLSEYKENFYKMVEDLTKTPLIWNIKNGEIIDVQCDNKYLRDISAREVFEIDKNFGMRIGEIGFPANLYVLNRDLTGKLLIDEKGRVHMAHGEGYQARTNCEYKSVVHSDGLASKVNLYSTRLNKYFMVEDKYNLEIFHSLTK